MRPSPLAGNVEGAETPRPVVEIWTIGHSTLGFADFAGELASFRIELLADVRRFPASRRYPHFEADSLRHALAVEGIDYMPCRELGGRRKPRPDSHNTAWRNESFRGYADYMETPEFQCALAALLDRAGSQRTAIMCAEAVWWRCHRALISDLLKSRSIVVTHIMSAIKSEEHPYTSAARIVDGVLNYSAPPDQEALPF